MSLLASFDFARLRQRPRWIVPLSIAALLSGAMPVIHRVVFGPALIASETVLRALAFAGAVLFVAPERVVTLDWTRVGRSNFAFLEGLSATARWTTFVSSVDIITIVSVAVAALGLMAMDRKLGIVRAIMAASVWPAVGVAFRVVMAGLLGFPLR